MSLEYIRKTYNVPAKRGMPVLVNGFRGVITGADGQYIRVRFHERDYPVNCHPTWNVTYFEKLKAVK